MALPGIFVAVSFPEDNFTPVQGRRWAASLLVLKREIALARRDREILLVLAVTVAVNGAGMINWLFVRRLVDLGLPGDPAVSYGAVGILSSAAGVIALRLVETRIEGAAASQAETAGEVVGGLALVVTAQAAGMSAAFVSSGALIACVGALIATLRVKVGTLSGLLAGRSRCPNKTGGDEEWQRTGATLPGPADLLSRASPSRYPAQHDRFRPGLGGAHPGSLHRRALNRYGTRRSRPSTARSSSNRCARAASASGSVSTVACSVPVPNRPVSSVMSARARSG